ncbi:hypothetical protein [Streptomyces telluris]|uniref:hypothetical protein n=1 Tax=Streptomyces telluris TaxID=2720021 RepID=UPI00143AA7F9|nr:hypothetical protein [Streptomyces telluris]NJP77780.1 hypothetical protein [Streptomyces telluris]
MALVLVALLWWLIRAVARQGGFRPACRRAAWELRMTRRAFAQPFRARGLHRRRIRTLTSFLADPAVPALVDHALTGAERAAGEGCRAAAAAVSADRRRVAVVLAGHSPRAAAAPWREAGGEPGDWTWSAEAAAITPGAEAPPARRTLPLVVGADRLSGATVVADWTSGPPALSLEGDARVVRSVLQSLAAQLDLLADGPAVQVARGVHPRYPGRELDRILDELESSASAEDAEPVVLVCWTPTPAQRERLAGLCASGRVRALIGGRLPGHCWTLHAEPGGRLLGPGTGIDVESAALSRAVGTAIKKYRRRGTGWWAARDVPTGPPAGPGGGDGGAGPVPPAQEPPETDPGARAGAETGAGAETVARTGAEAAAGSGTSAGPVTGAAAGAGARAAAGAGTAAGASAAGGTCATAGTGGSAGTEAGAEPSAGAGSGARTPAGAAAVAGAGHLPVPAPAAPPLPVMPAGPPPGAAGPSPAREPEAVPASGPGVSASAAPDPGAASGAGSPGPSATGAGAAPVSAGTGSAAPTPGPLRDDFAEPEADAAVPRPAPDAPGPRRGDPAAGRPVTAAATPSGAGTGAPAPAAPGPRRADVASGGPATAAGLPSGTGAGSAVPATPRPPAGDFAEPAAPSGLPGAWLEPEPEPEGGPGGGAGKGSRPASGVSAVPRTHPDRTPEHP